MADAHKVFQVARDVFSDGIWVKADVHPCGYDWLSFRELEEEDIDTYKFEIGDFSGNIYNYEWSYPLEDKTLQEILDELGDDGYCYERGTMPRCQ